MIGLAFLAQLLIMLGAPIVLVLFVRRRWKTPWLVFVAGALVWIGSQAVHMPLNWGLEAAGVGELSTLAIALILGFTPALCEETARWLMLRYGLTGVRDWRGAIGFGAGHGGFESIALGVLVGAMGLYMAALSRVDPETLNAIPGMDASQVEAFWSVPIWAPFLGGVERLMSMVFHLSAAALVTLGVARGRLWPLLAAIAWHWLTDAVAVYVVRVHGGVAAELAILALMPIAVGVLWWTSRALSQDAPGPNDPGDPAP